MKAWVCTGKTMKTVKNDGHPVYTRYPFLKMKYYAKRKEFFAWLPKRLLNGKWVWLTKVVKTTYSTRKSIVPERPFLRLNKTVYKQNVFYETPDQIAQRILSNEN